MPKTDEQNRAIQEARRRQILDAASSVYVRFGYHATDMDRVAAEAGLAKGLLYYYFKTKQQLFRALFEALTDENYAISDALLDATEGQPAVERLMRYTCGIFAANAQNPRMMQFAMRMPFDAYAIFAPDGWHSGAEKSDIHRKSLTNIIQAGMDEGAIPPGNAHSAANSFWSVFVANAFEYSRLMQGKDTAMDSREALTETVRFCFQGLGIPPAEWEPCFEKVRGEVYEAL